MSNSKFKFVVKKPHRVAFGESAVSDTLEMEKESGLPSIQARGILAEHLLSQSATCETINQLLDKYGAILLRGFDVDSPEKMEIIADKLLDDIYTQNTEHVPVSNGTKVQTPVKYSAKEFLLWHNENTFNKTWPGRILFGCARPAQEGGRTPLVDTRKVFQQLPKSIRDEFVNKGVMYERRYSSDDSIGLSWKTIFNTNNKNEVEQKCETQSLIYRWHDDQLVTHAIRPATYQHPNTGETCWVNQSPHWHFSCLSDELKNALVNLYPDGSYPRNCYFGDGTTIPDEYMDVILNMFKENEVSFQWKKGDLMCVDNAISAHARTPFSGERKIFVCLGNMESF